MKECKEEMPFSINTVVSWLSCKWDLVGRAIISATLLELLESGWLVLEVYLFHTHLGRVGIHKAF